MKTSRVPTHKADCAQKRRRRGCFLLRYMAAAAVVTPTRWVGSRRIATGWKKIRLATRAAEMSRRTHAVNPPTLAAPPRQQCASREANKWVHRNARGRQRSHTHTRARAPRSHTHARTPPHPICHHQSSTFKLCVLRTRYTDVNIILYART